MPGKGYNVDEILKEIREQQNAGCQAVEPSAQSALPVPPETPPLAGWRPSQAPTVIPVHSRPKHAAESESPPQPAAAPPPRLFAGDVPVTPTPVEAPPEFEFEKSILDAPKVYPEKSRIDSAGAAKFLTGSLDAEPPKDAPRRRAKMQPPVEKPSAEKQPSGAEKPASPKPTEALRTGRKISEQLRSMDTMLSLRIVVNMLAVLIIFYIALSAQLALPLPGFLDDAALRLWVMVGALAISAIFSLETVGAGLSSLLTFRPNSDSYSALAVLACLLEGSYLASQPLLYEQSPGLLYLPLAAVMLLFNTVGKHMRLNRVVDSYRLASGAKSKATVRLADTGAFTERLCASVLDEPPRVACITANSKLTGFAEESMTCSRAEGVSAVIAPVTALASLVMAGVSWYFNRDIFTAAVTLTATLCMTAPVAGAVAASLPLMLTDGRLRSHGATLCGYRCADELSDVNAVIVRCSELFPEGAVTLHGVKTIDRQPIDQAIIDAASVLCACDSTLTGVFRAMVSDGSILRPVESIDYEDGQGVSAWVGGKRVLIGSRELMEQNRISLPDKSVEAQLEQKGRQLLYLASSGEACAMFVVSYKPEKALRRALELLSEREVAVFVLSSDPNVTEQRIAELYRYPAALLKVIPARLMPLAQAELAPRDSQPAGLIHNGTAASCLFALSAAAGCRALVTVETVLVLLSVVAGFAISTFFAFSGSIAALSWVTVAVYQLFWMALQLFIPLFR